MTEARLRSADELDRAVHQFLIREYGIAAAMQFFTRYRQSDGIDYTRDRKQWLPGDPDSFARFMAEPCPEMERAATRHRATKAKGAAATPRKAAARKHPVGGGRARQG